MANISESELEKAALEWLEQLGYETIYGPDLAPGAPSAERESYADVVLSDRLRSSLETINPDLAPEVIEEAIRQVTRIASPNLFENNCRFHKFLVDGIDVEYRAEGRTAYRRVRLVDFAKPDNNDWLVANQFTVIENKHNRRLDVVVFVNGLPLGAIELKNPGDENATVQDAFQQLQTYKTELPSFFIYNEVLAVSDLLDARFGTISSDWNRFMPWRGITGNSFAPKRMAEANVLIKGIFDKQRFLDLLRYFIVWDSDGQDLTKKMAGYHQYYAVNKAINRTLEVTAPEGDKRIGVVWHTQGSGKSLTMAFYAGKAIQHPALENPTLVVVTDRNDLDDQLFGTFAGCSDLLRQNPVQAQDREELQKLLQVASGGVVFTTMQKFSPEGSAKYPLLSDRHNILVIADEAHRSQYGLKSRVVKNKISQGFALHLREALPNASFIGFTGTPIERADKSTRTIFGSDIDIYDIQRAVEDEATVKIYYEGRMAAIALDPSELPKIDAEFEEVTEGEEQAAKEKLKSKWSRLEALAGSEKRLALIAKDIIQHFQNRQSILEGKAAIVCTSRRICVELYRAIIELRPDWHSDDDDKGAIKIVMTGSAADPVEWQPHIRNKSRRKELAKRFKNAADEMKLAIVRDMWLTGFDAPCLHTIYIDKPMRGHNLMQAIARVNRVFNGKPGGLVVDYIGIADQLKEALQDYTEGDKKQTGIPLEEAAAIMTEKYQAVAGFLSGFDYSQFFSGSPGERISVIPAAMNRILQESEDSQQEFIKAVTALSQAFALAVTHEKAAEIRDEVALFQAIRAGLVKHSVAGSKVTENIDSAVRQIVSQALISQEVVDLFAALGLKKPEVSILSDEFLEQLRGLPHRNLALELLRKLINDEIKTRRRHNIVQARSFAAMLAQTILRYQNRSLETTQVIAELIALAKEIRAARYRGERLGISEEELAFYDALADALEVSEGEVWLNGDGTLRRIASELVQSLRRNATLDWTQKQSVKAKLRTIVKRLLRQYDYPADKQEKATVIVLEQAEALSEDWAA